MAAETKKSTGGNPQLVGHKQPPIHSSSNHVVAVPPWHPGAGPPTIRSCTPTLSALPCPPLSLTTSDMATESEERRIMARAEGTPATRRERAAHAAAPMRPQRMR